MNSLFQTYGLLPALLLYGISSFLLLAHAAEGRGSAPQNSASLVLLESATQDLNNGQLDQASADLERAVRIDPNNASLWHYLGQTRLHQGHYQEAEAFAAKSNTLVGNDAALRARNTWLINAARHSLNPPPPATTTATTAPAAALPARFNQGVSRPESNTTPEALPPAEPQITRLSAPSYPQYPQAQPSPEAQRYPFETQELEEPAPSRKREGKKAKKHVKHHKNLSFIPKGHRPPQGLCRIWFPDRPPGHQPPPDDCYRLRQILPQGAWLIR